MDGQSEWQPVEADPDGNSVTLTSGLVMRKNFIIKFTDNTLQRTKVLTLKHIPLNEYF